MVLNYKLTLQSIKKSLFELFMKTMVGYDTINISGEYEKKRVYKNFTNQKYITE